MSGCCAAVPELQSRDSSSHRFLPPAPERGSAGAPAGAATLQPAELSLLFPAAWQRCGARVTGTGLGCRAPGEKQESSQNPGASEAGPASRSTTGSSCRGSEERRGSEKPPPRAAPLALRGLPRAFPQSPVRGGRRERSGEGRPSGASAVPPPPPEPRLPLRLHFPACGAGAGQEVPCA